MAETFNVSDAAVSNVALSTQLGYAFGLLFIIPLGDKVSNKKILKIDFLVMVLALLAAGFSSSLFFLIASSFLIGLHLLFRSYLCQWQQHCPIVKVAVALLVL